MPKPLLNETEAAIKLGITKELLYAYIKNAPKKHLGDDRKLISVVEKGQNFFEITELKGFDHYLKQPWSKPTDKRPDIPSYIKDYLKTEIGGSCPITGKGSPLDNAHIEDYATSLNHHHHNLIRVAKDEHTKADSHIIPKQVLRDTKDRLIAALRKRMSAEITQTQSSFTWPQPDHTFVGRANVLSELLYAMTYERLIVIEGLGGVGKTELLLNALVHFKTAVPVIWIDVEPIKDMNDLWITLQRAGSEVLGTAAERALLDSIRDKECILVFDSLESLLISARDEIEDLIRSLMTKTNGIQLFITSQIDLSLFDSHKKLIKLSGLDDHHSQQLLQKQLPEKLIVVPEQLNWIMEFCNGHPLTIKLFSSLIRFYESVSDSIQVVNDALNVERPMRVKHTKSTSLDVCLSTIYDCLNVAERKLLMYVKCFSSGVKIDWLGSQFDKLSAKTDVAKIKQFFFLEAHYDSLRFERIAVPNPVRPFLRYKETLDPDINFEQIQKEFLENIMMEAMIVDAYYVEGGTHGPPAYGIQRFEDEFQNILDAFHAAQQKAAQYSKTGDPVKAEVYQNIIGGIAAALGKFCFTRGYFKQGLLFSQAGIAVNVALKRYESVGTQYMYLLQIQGRQYDHQNQEATLKEFEALAEQVNDPELSANALWGRGRWELEIDNYDTALKAYEKALELMKQHHASKADLNEPDVFSNNKILQAYARSLHPGNIALLISEIAKVYEFSGRYGEAIPRYRETMAVQQKFNDETNAFSTLHHLGYCLIAMGEKEEGIECLMKTVIGFNEHGQYEYLANSLSVLGKIAIEDPSLSQNVIFSEDIIDNGVENLFHQLEEFIVRVSATSGYQEAVEHIPSSVIGKYLYITALLSFSDHYPLLAAYNVGLSERLPIKDTKPGIFASITNLSYGVGSVDVWKQHPEAKSQWLKTIYQACLILNGGPDIHGKTMVFQWLAKWFDHTGIIKGTTPEQLFQNAWNSFGKKN